MKVIKEMWQLFNKYFSDLWAFLLTYWYFIKIEDLSKINQIIVTCYLIFLFYHAIRKRYPRKKGRIMSFFGKLIKRNKTVRYVGISEEGLEDSVESSLNLIDTIRKDGKKDMMKVASIFGRFFKFLRANKFTSSGNIAVIWFYYIITEELFAEHGVKTWQMFIHEDKWFYAWLGGYTVSAIVGLIAVNGFGWESIKDWLTRINFGTLNSVLNKLGDADVKVDTDFIETLIPKAEELLNKVRPFIREALANEMTDFINNIKKELKDYKAKVQYEKDMEEVERFKRLQELANSRQQTPPNNEVTIGQSRKF